MHNTPSFKHVQFSIIWFFSSIFLTMVRSNRENNLGFGFRIQQMTQNNILHCPYSAHFEKLETSIINILIYRYRFFLKNAMDAHQWGGDRGIKQKQFCWNTLSLRWVMLCHRSHDENPPEIDKIDIIDRSRKNTWKKIYFVITYQTKNNQENRSSC